MYPTDVQMLPAFVTAIAIKAKLLPWSEGVTYRIVVKTDAPPEEDPFDEYEYVGDAEVFITNLPLDDQADEECMVRWLKEGILDGDQMYKDACQELEAKEEAIINVKKRLKDLPFLTLEGRSQEQEAAERKALKVRSLLCFCALVLPCLKHCTSLFIAFYHYYVPHAGVSRVRTSAPPG